MGRWASVEWRRPPPSLPCRATGTRRSVWDLSASIWPGRTHVPRGFDPPRARCSPRAPRTCHRMVTHDSSTTAGAESVAIVPRQPSAGHRWRSQLHCDVMNDGDTSCGRFTPGVPSKHSCICHQRHMVCVPPRLESDWFVALPWACSQDVAGMRLREQNKQVRGESTGGG